MTALSQRVRLAVVVGLALVATAAFSLWLGSRIVSPDQAIADAAPPLPSLITAEVVEQPLAQSVTVRGRIGVEGVEITAMPSAGPIGGLVTGVRVSAGENLPNGHVPFVIDGRPIIVLEGVLPAYRDLRPGSSGPDVTQLQSALLGLGYQGETRDPEGFFGLGTQEMVASLYDDLGFEVALTSPDASLVVASSRRGVADAEDALRLARMHRSAVLAPADRTRADMAIAHAERGLEAALETAGTAELNNGVMVPAGEVAFLPTGRAVVVSLSAQTGVRIPGDSVLALVGVGDPMVEVDLTDTQRLAFSVGETALVTSAASGETFEAILTAISGTPRSDVERVYRAVLAPVAGVVLGPLGEEVLITVTTAETIGEVLAVPLAAVSGRADGTATVAVLREGHPETVGVRVGLSAQGLVEITPLELGTIRVGDLVALGYLSSGG